jgi:hypothetical protein
VSAMLRTQPRAVHLHPYGLPCIRNRP